MTKGDFMKKLIIIAVIMSLLSGCSFFTIAPEIVGLIPLDSRPCNTQYPEILGKMGNMQLDIPYAYLDNFLEPAQTKNLWSWLEASGKGFNRIIINTTELFNGGLIASRDPQSYQDLVAQIARLKSFCEKNKNKDITVITVLPRLLPSQFTQLWPYNEEIAEYAQNIDIADREGKKAPEPPQSIPKDMLNEYLGIYENTQLLVESLISFANEGLIDHYLIGQDDAEEYGLSNKIVRELTPKLNDKVQFVHGADELTMLVLARVLPLKENLSLKVEYSNRDLKEAYFPFEAASLENVVKTKLNYLNIMEATDSDKRVIIHNDAARLASLRDLIQESASPYLGLMDIAHTNKGDINLLDFLLNNDTFPKVTGYAGWNTAGNTIGTELSHAVYYQYLADSFKKYKKPAQAEALQAYLEFKFIRIAEDLVYQGILREELNERLKTLNIDPHNIGERHAEANGILAELYAPYDEKLAKAFIGQQFKIGEISFTVEKISSKMELPWSRTFEAKVSPEAVIVLLGED